MASARLIAGCFDFGKIVVQGHAPVDEPDIRPNRINIDTGAYATGKLTCLILEQDKRWFCAPPTGLLAGAVQFAIWRRGTRRLSPP
jgi:hypothetical protein